METVNVHELMEVIWKKTFIFLRFTNLASVAKKFEIADDEARAFVYKHFHLIDGLTLVDPFRLAVLIDLIKKIKNIDGDIVECGSFKGGTGIMMALALKHFGIKKHIHLFDSFQGLPQPDGQKDKGYVKGAYFSDVDALQAKINTLGLSGDITLYKGWFSETIPPFLTHFKKPIALLHIDCDLYASTKDSFPLLYPLVSASAPIILDDFNDGGQGEKRAVLEVLAGQKIVMHVGPAPQVYFFKGEHRVGEQHYDDQGMIYDFDTLMHNDIYLKWLDGKLGFSLQEKLTQLC